MDENHELQNTINEIGDRIVYLQLMGSFAPGANFQQVKDLVVSTSDFIKNSTLQEQKERAPELLSLLIRMTDPIIGGYPLKRPLRSITVDFNDLFKNGNEVYSYGLDFGWLEQQMDLANMHMYSDTPYHYKVGLGAHKGNGSIEEDFLLKDAFNTYCTTQYYYTFLHEYGDQLKKDESKGLIEFNQKYYQELANIKFQVAAFARLTIVSFYAFVEAFVNSIGHNYILRNQGKLTQTQVDLLNGKKKNNFLSLKSKMEKFQEVIRQDGKVKIPLSDPAQIIEPLRTFFDDYEQLRNSAVHYAPTKEKIWMTPQDWMNKASEFSKISCASALTFWKACFPNSEGPEYLGKLDYDMHINKANARLDSVKELEQKRKDWL